MKKIIFYFLTGMFFLMPACKKEKITPVPSNPNYPPPTLKLNPAALEFVQLPVNRYFIYKDSASGSTDSVRVTQSGIATKFQKGTPASTDPLCIMCSATSDYYYEEYTLKLSKASGQDWFKAIASLGGVDRRFFSNIPVILVAEFVLVNEQFNLPAFWYPFTIFGVNMYKYISSLTIEGTSYTEVQVFFWSNGLQPSEANYQQTIFYWVKGIGIIKKDIRTYNSVITSLLVRYG